MGERLLCKQEVIGSIPFTSTMALGSRVAETRRSGAGREQTVYATAGSCARLGKRTHEGKLGRTRGECLAGNGCKTPCKKAARQVTMQPHVGIVSKF